MTAELPAEVVDPRYTATSVVVRGGQRPAWRSQREFDPGTHRISGTLWVNRDVLDRPDWRRYVAEAEAEISRTRGWLLGESPQVGDPEWGRQRADGCIPVPMTMLVTVQS